MPRSRRWTVMAVLIALGVPACSSDSASESVTEPAAQLQEIEGTDLMRVVLSAQAVERIGLQTSSVTDAPGPTGTSTRAVPYASILYDPSGQAWVYTIAAERTYVRTPVVVERVDGDVALLSDGPPSGTAVVTVGAAELYGAESTFGED